MKPTEQVLHLCAVSGWAARSGLLGTMVNGQLKGLFRESAPLAGRYSPVTFRCWFHVAPQQADANVRIRKPGNPGQSMIKTLNHFDTLGGI
jgi:hypothetical protein